MNTLKDWIDVTYKASDRISYFWRFSTWLNILTIGWVFVILIKRPELSFAVKLLITVFYLVGYLMSLGALLKSYVVYEVIIDESIKATEENQTQILKTLKDTTLKYPRTTAIVSHVIYAAILLTLIWQPNIIAEVILEP